MAITLAQMRSAAQVLADMVGDPFLLDPEWDGFLRDGIQAFWADVCAANKDFRNNVLAFTLTSTNSVSLPSDFREVRFVRRDPGQTTQIILNKLGQRSASQGLDRSYRLQDRSLYIEPLANCAGNYDLVYYPTAPALASPDFTVRIATAGADLGLGVYAGTGGPGPGRTLTSTNPGVTLLVDGVVPAVGDRVLHKDAGASPNNGIYTVTQVASGGVPWIVVRATDFDQNSEIRLNQRVLVNEGTVNAMTVWRVSSFSDVDSVSMAFAADTSFVTTLDAEIEPHRDYFETYAAILALSKDESDTSTLMRIMNGVPGTDEIGIRGRVKRWASDQRSADPDQVEDVRGRRRRPGWL